MSNNLFNVDKSPTLALAKNVAKNTRLASALLLTTATIFTTVFTTGVVNLKVAGVETAQPAHASEIKFILEFIANNGGDIYRLMNEGRIRQFWFTSYDGNHIQRQFGSSANVVLHRWCSNTYSDRMRLNGPDHWVFWTSARWYLVQGRFENGRGNCYMRRVAR